jgi:hypothetical protein
VLTNKESEVNLKAMSIKKLRQLIAEIKLGGVGVKDLYLIRSIENEITRRMICQELKNRY